MLIHIKSTRTLIDCCLIEVFSDTPDGHFINQAAVNLLQHQTQDLELTEEVLLQFLFDMIFR
jgi:hypothetical protein